MRDYHADIDLANKNSSHTIEVELIGSGKSVIDFGCYTGLLAGVLETKGCRVTGIEYDREAAEAAKEHCDRVIIADLDDIDLESALGAERFDVALFGDVLEHLRDPGGLLKQTREMLSPEGFIVVSVPNVAHMSVRLALLRGEFEYEDAGILDDTHLRFFTRKSIVSLLETCGFHVEDVRWTVKALPGESISETLGPLGLSTLKGVLESLSDLESTVFQYVLKASKATESKRLAALADSTTGLSRKVKRLEQELGETSEVLKEAKKEQEAAARYTRGLERSIQQKNAYIKQLESEVDKLKRQATGMSDTQPSRSRSRRR